MAIRFLCMEVMCLRLVRSQTKLSCSTTIERKGSDQLTNRLSYLLLIELNNESKNSWKNDVEMWCVCECVNIWIVHWIPWLVIYLLLYMVLKIFIFLKKLSTKTMTVFFLCFLSEFYIIIINIPFCFSGLVFCVCANTTLMCSICSSIYYIQQPFSRDREYQSQKQNQKKAIKSKEARIDVDCWKMRGK